MAVLKQVLPVFLPGILDEGLQLLSIHACKGRVPTSILHVPLAAVVWLVTRVFHPLCNRETDQYWQLGLPPDLFDHFYTQIAEMLKEDTEGRRSYLGAACG